jgi:hypothetical protein
VRHATDCVFPRTNLGKPRTELKAGSIYGRQVLARIVLDLDAEVRERVLV